MPPCLFLLKQLFAYIVGRRRKQLALLFVVMVLASIAEVVSIGAVLPFLGVLMSPERVFANPLVQPIVAILGLNEPSQLLFPLTLIFIVGAIFAGAMRVILLWGQTRLGYAIGADFSIRIYKNTLYQPYSVHLSRNSSHVIAAIATKTNTVINHSLLPLLFVASSTLILLAILVALILIDPFVALVTLGGFSFLYGFIAFATRKRLARDGERISHESNQVIKALQEGLGGIRDVLIDGTQDTYCKLYSAADLPMRKSQANIQIISGAPRFVIEAFGMALIAALAYGLTLESAGAIGAIPLLGMLALGAQRMLPALQLIYWSVSSIRGHEAALRDILNLLDQPLPEHAGLPQAPVPFTKSIRLKQIGFQYGETSSLVVQGVDFEIPKGSCVGFIGTTGSGKSTLLDIIMGLLQPSEGDLSVDGLLIDQRNSQAWQAHIAHVPQSIFLADTTIAENIAFGVPPDEIDCERVKIAAHQACIASVVEALPNKYKTYVGERGIRLSGGQRQRIGIARALYKQADVIVFDEATSALDNQTECAVIDSIESVGNETTVLMVAHRLTTLKKCDFVIELEHGKVKRRGTYEEIVHIRSIT